MDTTLQDAVNEQIRNEFYAGYLYLAMSVHFHADNLDGFAHWMRLQYQEEISHAMRLIEHMVDRDARVVLKSIDEPPSSFESPIACFEQALEHERSVTERINELYELALQKKDYPLQQELQWFITEQVEEEKNSGGVVEQLRMIGDNRAALLMMDRQLAARGPED